MGIIQFATNTIPQPYGPQMEAAVRRAIGGRAGTWMVRLFSEQHSDNYYVRIVRNGGEEWKWTFEGLATDPGIVSRRIAADLESPVSERLIQNRAEVLRIANHCGAQRLRVFGSIAAGNDKPGSDVDLLIEASPATTALAVIRMAYQLEALLDCHVDIATETQLSPHLRDQILREAIELDRLQPRSQALR